MPRNCRFLCPLSWSNVWLWGACRFQWVKGRHWWGLFTTPLGIRHLMWKTLCNFEQHIWLEITIRTKTITNVGTGKRGHYERGLFTSEISGISKISKFSRRWSDSPWFSSLAVLQNSLDISRFFKIYRKWTFLKAPFPFPKDPVFRTRKW